MYGIFFSKNRGTLKILNTKWLYIEIEDKY